MYGDCGESFVNNDDNNNHGDDVVYASFSCKTYGSASFGVFATKTLCYPLVLLPQFGVFDADAGFKGGESPDLTDEASLVRAVLQPGNKLLAAGYCLYSSTTILVFTLGGGTHGFTLDPTINEFVLTHPNMRIPKRGNIYSANEAYSEGWDDNFKKYLKALKTGTGETGQRYTQRYIGSMVGDVRVTFCFSCSKIYVPSFVSYRFIFLHF